MPEYLSQPAGLPAANGYSHAVVFSGRTVAISGQVPVDSDGVYIERTVEAQVRQVFTNLGIALAAAGTSFENVVKLNYFVVDMADLPTIRSIRNEFLSPDRLPASTLVQVVGLVNPAFRVEIDALAVIP